MSNQPIAHQKNTDEQTAYIKNEIRKSLIVPVRIVAVLAVISGLFALIFEVSYYKNVSMYVYAFRFFAVAVSFWVLIISSFDYGKKYPDKLAHLLLLSIILSFGAIIIFLPETLTVNAQIAALIIFTTAIFLTWEVKDQIIVAIYYNLIFGATIMLSSNGIYFLQNIFVSVLFVLFLSSMSIAAVAVNYKLRKNSLMKTLKLINSEKKFREIFENSSDGLFQADINGNVITSNNAFRKIFSESNLQNQICFTDKNFFPSNSFDKIIFELETSDEIKDMQLTLKTFENEEKICGLDCRLIDNGNNNPKIIEGSLHDVTVKQKAAEALIDAKKKAEESEKLKTEFLAQMSHEIRTPLNSIIQSIELLKDEQDILYNHNLMSILEIMDSASKRIVRTIHLILHIAEVSNGAYKTANQVFDVYSDCLQDLYEEFSDVADRKNINFRLLRKTENTRVFGDSYSIKNIFENILDNSFKFTSTGFVEILTDADDNNNLKIEISDSGVGISDEFLDKIYDIFTQEEQGYTRKYDGNGLGLTLVKKYCELNNADIAINSIKNGGTNVSIIFKNLYDTNPKLSPVPSY